ncbi:MAG: c-type cytochrome [Oceanipulchritudo sp.]
MNKNIIIATATIALVSLTGYADDSGAQATWDKHCKKCHASDGSADTPLGKKLEIKDYTDPASLAELSDEDLFNMTKDGVEGTKMPGFGKKLSDDEIKELVALMRGMSAE